MVVEKKKTVADIRKDALKKFDLKIGPISSIVEDVKAISTGNIAIDFLTGINGFPIGRSIEVFGPPSSGKTTVALQCAASMQKIIKAGGSKSLGIGPDDKIVYIDFEQAMDKNYCVALGFDPEHESVLFMQPSTLEEGAEIARELVKTGEVRLLIWDSVAAAAPDAVVQKEIGGSVPAAAAKIYAVFTQTLNEPLKVNNCTAIWINHISEMMDMGMARRPGMPARTTTPGGRALKFYSSVRIEFKNIGNVKTTVVDKLTKEEQQIATATDVKVVVVKNKVGPPHKTAVVRVRFGKGFDNFYTAMQILLAHKKIMYKPGYFYFDKTPHLVHEEMGSSDKGRYIRSEAAVYTFADEHLDWRQLVIDEAEKIALEAPEVLNIVAPSIVDLDEETEDELEVLLGNKKIDKESPEARFTRQLLDDM